MRVGSFKCSVCGETVGNTERYQHYNRHVREGKMIKKVGWRRWEFYVNDRNRTKAE